MPAAAPEYSGNIAFRGGLNFTHQFRGIVTALLLDVLKKQLSRVVPRESRKSLQLLLMLDLMRFYLRATDVHGRLPRP